MFALRTKVYYTFRRLLDLRLWYAIHYNHYNILYHYNFRSIYVTIAKYNWTASVILKWTCLLRIFVESPSQEYSTLKDLKISLFLCTYIECRIIYVLSSL